MSSFFFSFFSFLSFNQRINVFLVGGSIVVAAN
jgi:hypothetical protein